MTEIDHDNTREVVCPYCGYEEGDSWELPDDGEHECGGCEKTFIYYRDVEVTYTSMKIGGYNKCGECGVKLDAYSAEPIPRVCTPCNVKQIEKWQAEKEAGK